MTGSGRNFGCDSGSARGFRTTEITEFHGKKLQDKQTPTVRSSPTHSAFPFPFSRRSRSILVLVLILLLIFFLTLIVVVILIIVRDPEAPHRDVLSAVSAILTSSKINLANVALTIKVQTHEELEERVTEIERMAGLGKPE
jgi:hypothetical protein